ncbi:MAG: DsrE family protein [Flavobacteriaceae bacterium]|nr:DsrE family protein [Flavobacteriaceae bacterium]
MNYLRFLIPALFLVSIHLTAQNERSEGKIIRGYGPTFQITDPDIKTEIDSVFKVIFDVSESSADKSLMNGQLETAARFYNMHAKAGMKAEQLKVAVTIHGGAWQDILTNKAYKKLYGSNNPNSKLIEMLSEAGADIILCGQTASFRRIKKEDIIPEVKIALSAMTALLQYQNNGYRFIKF